MNIEIWSDVVCPFCYIGKRHLEIALRDSGLADQVSIEWKSYQLDPGADAHVGKSLHAYLSESKGMTLEQAQQMSTGVSERGSAVGIDFNFEKAIVANTRLAHHLLHFSKTKGIQYEMKERLFKAYFIEGQDMNSEEVLADLALEMGLNRDEVLAYLGTTEADKAFHEDLQWAQQFGIRGVPFFVFNRKYALSGAQPISTFIEVLEKVKAEETVQPEIVNEASSDASCDVDNPNC